MGLPFIKKGRGRKRPSEIVAVDIATTGLKAVRMRMSKDGLMVVGADILSPVSPANPETKELRYLLPKSLMANYTALSVTGESAVVRILNMPSHPETGGRLTDEDVREHLGLGDGHRIGYAATSPAVRAKGEAKMLVVGLPEVEAQSLLRLVNTAAPAPFSIEVAGLAALTAFLKGPGAAHAQEALAVIESGARVTFMAIFHRGTLALVRKFDFGGDSLVAKVQQELGIDAATAQGIINDGSFDIGQPVHEVMDPFLRQLSISKDFVERREDCRLTKIFLSGGTSLCRYWQDEVLNAAGIEVERWNPFDSMHVAEGAIPENLKGFETRFTAAVGAGLGVFDET